MERFVKGFSKRSKKGKVAWLSEHCFVDPARAVALLNRYCHADEALQRRHDEFSENTLSNFYMPFGVAPNFLINGKPYVLPMVIEESSVVAAASKTASYWRTRGGFTTQVLGLKKVGQVHFRYRGDSTKLELFFERIKHRFFEDTESLTQNMRRRGGGITRLDLVDKCDLEPYYYQLHAEFNTADAMGANFINSCLEQFAKTLEAELRAEAAFTDVEKAIQVIMCIVSNYTPECLVRATTCCPIADLTDNPGLSPSEFAEKFERAVHMARIEPHRAVTHNKGIMNGVDAVALATGNDFRALEACAHAYAARDGQYRSLTQLQLEVDRFCFSIDLPVSVGTVGGLTTLHPLVALSLEMLGHPSVPELMGIIAVAGLAQNFAAVRSLVTTGIQQGHMKMHLLNILNQLGATEREKPHFIDYFRDKVVTYAAVEQELKSLRAAAYG